ncbi:MAG: carbohydrate-binding protein [Microbacterium sp.]|nr:MAG: carbohydrate-binding protein [Microbacterium sp.]
MATKRTRIGAAIAVAGVAASVTGCAGGASAIPEVNTDSDKPFVLDGVENLTEIAQLTGPGAINDTASVGVAGTDLGSMTNIGDRTYFFFGDTFGERDPDSYGGQGGFWRSNVSAWTTDDDPSDGITFDGWAPVDDVGLASALIEGDHDPNDGAGEVTKIPTYGFAIGETLYVSYMSVNYWGEAGQWDSTYAALVKSDDQGVSWQPVDGPRWPGDSNFVQVATQHVRDDGVEYIYFWCIPSGRFGGVQLMRVEATTAAVEDAAADSYFTGTDSSGAAVWSDDLTAAETIVDGTIGELSVMWSTYLERWVMTYSDAGNAYIREGLTPWGPWGDAIELVSATDYPGLYSPYLNPRYVANDGRTLYFTLSLWGPYNVFWFSIDLVKHPL